MMQKSLNLAYDSVKIKQVRKQIVACGEDMLQGEIMKSQRISDDVKLGKGVKIYDFVNLYGCEIGENSIVGAGRV